MPGPMLVATISVARSMRHVLAWKTASAKQRIDLKCLAQFIPLSMCDHEDIA